MKESRKALMEELNSVQDNMKRSITEHDKAFGFLVAAADKIKAGKAACDEQGRRAAQLWKAVGYDHDARARPLLA